MRENSESWTKLSDIITENDAEKMYLDAVESMTRLNKLGAELMHKYKCRAATDVTGFGLKGHAENLVKFQKQRISIQIHTLPIIKNVVVVAQTLGRSEKLLTGRAVETSGGLLMCIPASEANGFCQEFEKLCGFPAWIIGHVEAGEQIVSVIDNPKIINFTK